MDPGAALWAWSVIHFEVAKTLGNLALAYGELGDYKVQKQMTERVLQITEQHYGRDHFQAARVLDNLADAHGMLGDYEIEQGSALRA